MPGSDKKDTIREYKVDEVVWFRKTKEAFGGLSNMCSGYPLNINGHKILTSEALYQACRFPDSPEIQRLIINERSPMAAKMKSKPHRTKYTRKDWDEVRIKIMRWSLQVKLAQNFITFGKLLEDTYSKDIVEDSRKDKFWGAVREKNNENTLIGVNALGRLLMELRQKYSENKYDLFVVEPLKINNFKLFGKEISRIDERANYLNRLSKHWGLDFLTQLINIIEEKQHPIKNELSFDNQKNKDSNKTTQKAKKIQDDSIEEKIMVALKNGETLFSKEIVGKIQVDWNSNKMTSYLKKLKEIERVEGKPLKFRLKDRFNKASYL